MTGLNQAEADSLKLYSYFRSSAAFRVRIALQLKGVTVDVVPVHLLRDGGQQHSEGYRWLNPQQLVPSLQFGSHVLTQSLAIIEWLDSEYPLPSLLPGDTFQQAKIRSVAQQIACDIHPLNNLRVLNYLKQQLTLSELQLQQWYQHWISSGFEALESCLTHSAGLCCFADEPTLADLCLIPQVYNALRFHVLMEDYPLIERIYLHCMKQPAFQAATPEQQPDAE